MMLPDYNLISEIFLFSNGFLNATLISKKLVAASRLASEQVSQLSLVIFPSALRLGYANLEDYFDCCRGAEESIG